jgi:uncharacterized protein
VTLPARVNLVTLGVADLDRAIAFYTTLGWRTSSSSVDGEVAFFHTEGPVLALWPTGELARDANITEEQREFDERGLIELP